MSEHTKGPWTCVGEDGRLLAGIGVYLISTGAPDWRWVAKVDVPIHGVPVSTEEARANTHLIAAAPELLEALKLCVAELRDWMRNHGEDIGTLEAINKANTAMNSEHRKSPT